MFSTLLQEGFFKLTAKAYIKESSTMSACIIIILGALYSSVNTGLGCLFVLASCLPHS